MSTFNFDDFVRFVSRKASAGEAIDHSGGPRGAWCGCAIGLHFDSVNPTAAYDGEGYERNEALTDYAQEVEDYFADQPYEERAFAFGSEGFESVFELLNESQPATYAELDDILFEQYGH